MVFARAGMGYVGVWDRGGVEVAIDHLRRRSGELHGELVVSSAMTPVGYGKLHRASFNVSSTAAREKLGKVLAFRAKHLDVPWGDYLEEFCATVLEAERTGAPIVTVGSLPVRPSDRFLVNPFLPEHKTTILYAAGGTGKSYLAVLCAVGVMTGTSILGWGVRQTKVLYLDWETDEYELDDRVKRVSAGLGVDVPDLLYRPCAGPLDDMAESLSAVVATDGVGLVIVDSVGMASPTHAEAAEEGAIRLFSALRYLNCTVLAIDHVTGADAKTDTSVYKPYGSIYKVNLARSTWELKGTVPDEGDAHLALFNRKVNVGKLSPPVGVLVHHGEDEVTFKREHITDAGLATGMPHGLRIANVLAGGAMAVPDIADELGISEAIVRVTLGRGRNTKFVKTPEGTWGLLA